MGRAYNVIDSDGHVLEPLNLLGELHRTGLSGSGAAPVYRR